MNFVIRLIALIWSGKWIKKKKRINDILKRSEEYLKRQLEYDAKNVEILRKLFPEISHLISPLGNANLHYQRNGMWIDGDADPDAISQFVDECVEAMPRCYYHEAHLRYFIGYPYSSETLKGEIYLSDVLIWRLMARRLRQANGDYQPAEVFSRLCQAGWTIKRATQATLCWLHRQQDASQTLTEIEGLMA